MGHRISPMLKRYIDYWLLAALSFALTTIGNPWV